MRKRSLAPHCEQHQVSLIEIIDVLVVCPSHAGTWLLRARPPLGRESHLENKIPNGVFLMEGKCQFYEWVSSRGKKKCDYAGRSMIRNRVRACGWASECGVSAADPLMHYVCKNAFLLGSALAASHTRSPIRAVTLGWFTPAFNMHISPMMLQCRGWWWWCWWWCWSSRGTHTIPSLQPSHVSLTCGVRGILHVLQKTDPDSCRLQQPSLRESNLPSPRAGMTDFISSVAWVVHLKMRWFYSN